METRPIQSDGDWFFEKSTRLRSMATWVARHASCALHRACGNRCNDGFGILLYHRVAEPVSGVEPPTLNVSPKLLRQQLAGLLDLGFECWPLRRLIDSHRDRRAIPPNVFAITFDDGYENNYLHAWPVLRELNLPATIFVATKYLDTDRPFPFDDWPATGTGRVPPSAWRPLSTSQCEELLQDGLVTIGAHTHSHEKFLGRRDEFQRDMEVCLTVLRDRFGIDRPAFAFPYGYKSLELVEAARNLGVTCSLSTRPRRVLPEVSEYEWGRFWAADNDSPAMLAGRLSWHSTIAAVGKPLAAVLARADRATGRKVVQVRNGATNSELPRAMQRTSSP